jgi:hypothetical protein
MLYDDENKCMIVSRVGTVPELRALCIARTIPDGVRQFEFEFPYKQFKKIVLTSDNQYFIAYGYDKLKVNLIGIPKKSFCLFKFRKTLLKC